MSRALLWKLLLPGLLIFSGLGIAASDNVEIMIVKGDAVLLSQIDDWFMGAHASDATINTRDGYVDFACVYSSSGSYTMRLESSNPGPQLKLLSGSGDQMNYEIHIRNKVDIRRNRTRRLTMTSPVQQLGSFMGSARFDCSDTVQQWNVRFEPRVRKQDFNSAPPGIYQDVVTITVSPT